MKRKFPILVITVILVVSMCTSAFGASRSLSVGSMGDDVYELQQLLAAYGYFYDDATGYFGTATENAVVSFQYACGLYPDGVAGPNTLVCLGLYSDDDYYDSSYEADDSTSSVVYDTYWNDDSSLSRTLSNGCSGNDVAVLQSLLADYGYFYDVPSGFYGDVTEAAVLGFQYDYGLYPDGVAGPVTITALSGSYGGSEYYEEESTSSYYYDYTAILNAIDYTPAAASGYCASWVSSVLVNAGIYSSSPGYNANDYWANVCYSTDVNELQPGMVIAVRNSNSYLGSIYGHVGFYIGDGLVISSVGYKETLTLDEWISRYNNSSMGSYAAWGYAY